MPRPFNSLIARKYGRNAGPEASTEQSPSTPPFLGLPEEIVQSIARNLFLYPVYKDDDKDRKKAGEKALFALRLTCKDIYWKTYHLFGTRFFSTGTQVLFGRHSLHDGGLSLGYNREFMKLSKHRELASFVRSIMIGHVNFGLPEEYYSKDYREKERFRKAVYRVKGGMLHHFARFEEKFKILDTKSLAKAMARFPNLEKIEFSDEPIFHGARKRWVRLVAPLGDDADQDWCSACSTLPLACLRTRAITSMISALAVAGIKPRVLGLYPSLRRKLRSYLQKFPSSEFEGIAEFFSEVRDVQISVFDCNCDYDAKLCCRYTKAPQSSSTSDFFVRLLRSTTRLHRLYICHNITNAPTPSIRKLVAAEVHMPKLRTLHLEQLGARAEDLVMLLRRHSETLVKVEVNAVILTQGTWQEVLEELQTCHKLIDFRTVAPTEGEFIPDKIPDLATKQSNVKGRVVLFGDDEPRKEAFMRWSGETLHLVEWLAIVNRPPGGDDDASGWKFEGREVVRTGLQFLLDHTRYFTSVTLPRV
ncbi:uncharacterized protein BDZ99DRAFT_514214 [Mytilinidion resinicola]|uniref:Uncharacterized protein n=1 Tax=Mytilinidion resinicola TaxID=574789 RepID=A0A6A6ZBB5_9PEZI|nr:uncharacterized protein BDZ99DRAFT_514214 [Mytilinidion resinicola]KAF2817993.1 hypothetical protein BDZ99DRAFT_514214 [Mytilinidion resinicola]